MNSASASDLSSLAPGHARHDAHLAHHFDTPEQQFTSAKLGMWIFLGTEILMFGGLFCAYSVYRHNHPLVFKFGAEAYLNSFYGMLNTLVLITSSLTMAVGVRAAQLDQRRLLIICLGLTVLGGGAFLFIHGIEYDTKWDEHVWVGSWNEFNADNNAPYRVPPPVQPVEAAVKLPNPPAISAALRFDDANTNADLSLVKPEYNFSVTRDGHIRIPSAVGASPGPAQAPESPIQRFHQLSDSDQWRVNTFFSCYFLMTGLHSLHVIVGMALISWLLLRALRREFSSEYFTPVDLVGLYWHLVDIIWIFLFPLFYLIH